MYSNLEYRQIRLLELLPETDVDAGIRCHLRTVSLESNLKFEAISYCWGDPTDTKNIVLDGLGKAVTVNLYGALRCLRRHDESRVVWADAICINQADLDERAAQVRLMPELYATASCVHIGLGEEERWTAFACMLVPVIGSGLTFMDVRERLFPRLSGAEKAMWVLIPSLTALFSRPWFQRQWVLQEFALAQESLVHWGSYTAQMSHIRNTATALVNQSQAFQGLFPTWGSEETTAFNKLLELMLDSIALWFKHNNGYNGRIFAATQLLKCYNPLDKVYIVIGMVPCLKTIEINYAAEPAEIYRAVTLLVVQDEGNLDFLAFVSLLNRHVLPEGHSTWALKFLNSRITRGAQWSLDTSVFSCFNACAGFPMVVERCGSLALRLTGIEADIVSMVGPSWIAATVDITHQTDAEEMTSASKYNRIAQHRQQQFEGWNAYLGVSNHTLWRLMLRDTMPAYTDAGFKNWRRLKEDDLVILAGSREDGNAVLNTDLSKAYNERLANSIEQYPVGSKCYRTTGGRVGVSAANVEKNDVVFVLAGSTVPYILRRSQCARESYHTLVGPAYVHGIMDGELVGESEAAAADALHNDNQDPNIYKPVFKDVYLV